MQKKDQKRPTLLPPQKQVPKVKIEIYADGRAFYETKGGMLTYAALVGIDFVREAVRKNLAGRVTEAGPALEKRLKEHTLKGRFELLATIPDEILDESIAGIIAPAEQLPDGKENSAECAPTDGHDLRNENGDGVDPEGFSDRPDGDGHDANLPDGASGPGDGDADPDAPGDDRQGGM